MRMRTGAIPGVVAVAAAVLCVADTPRLTAQQVPADQTPAFRSGVEAVTVEVGVVDRQGLPMRGLTAADFIVTVGGKPRHVVSAEFVERGSTTVVAPRRDGGNVSTNEGGGSGRLFAFIVDQNTLDLGNARRVGAGAAPFFTRLTYSDRSALLILPLGPNVEFTSAHEKVQDGLRRVTGMGRPNNGWEFGSLADARAISNHSQMALRTIGERECGSGSGFGSSSASAGAGSAAPAPAPAPGAGGAGGGGGGGGAAGGGTSAGGAAPSGGGGGGGGGGGTRSAGIDGFGGNSCARSLQMQAEAAWRSAQTNSLSSIAALRQLLGLLAEVRGDKTVILISGGWPLDERDEFSLVSQVASEATAARVTVFSVFVPASSYSADRRMMSVTPLADDSINSGPLETLAGMTGGTSFRTEVGSEAVFERLGRELAGYYRVGIEKDPSDGAAVGRHMKVQISRGGATVRARELFDVPTYEDRDWAARLASAIDGPVLATEVGLRMTTYLSADPADSTRLRLLVSGEATRAQPGDGMLHVAVKSLDGRKVTGGQVPITNRGGDVLPFSMNLGVPPGSYVVRLGVIDSAGHVGSVDHRVDVHDVPLGPMSATGPILLAVPAGTGGEPRLALSGVRQDERLAFEVDLVGPKERLSDVSVDFEITDLGGTTPLLHSPAFLSPGTREGSVLAQGVSIMRGLPPGEYEVRAKVSSAGETVGDVRRGFTILEGRRAEVKAGEAAAPASRDVAILHTNASRMPVLTVQPFALDQVLAPPILGPFLERVAARPDSSAPAVQGLLERARSSGVSGLSIPDTVVTAAPAGAFLKGLTLLSENKLEPAAAAFRDAIRLAPDFYPAMVYLGACYAAGGKDKEAAAAWRTALIREGDAPELHAMLADAWLRQGRGDLAVADLEESRARWPEDMGLKRRFAVAALLGGQAQAGLQALDELLDNKIEDEPALALGLLTLYEAFESGDPIESVDRDRARMQRLAEVYKRLDGPSQALVDVWVAAVAAKK